MFLNYERAQRIKVMDRLEHFQDSEYACEENELALKHLDLALEV